jgi:ribonuclease G
LPSELLVSRAGGRTSTALREDGVTVELRVQDDDPTLAVGDIVKARVSKILPGIQSAFLDAGQDRDAFLHASDLLLPGEAAPPSPESFPGEAGDDGLEGVDGEADPSAGRRPARSRNTGPPIEDRLKEGRELVVQVVREGMGNKGPRVTSSIALPGRYLVYAPKTLFRGVSRRILDPAERQRLREIVVALPAEDGGFIVRTAGQGASPAAFEADARALVSTWKGIEARIPAARVPSTLHSDVGLFLRTLRDAPEAAWHRIAVDDEGLYREGLEYLRELDPKMASRIERHLGPEPLFVFSGVSGDIEKALRPRVWLRSGGTIVIEPTEALVSIDVNTGKFVGARRPEETVLQTNLEAADEIARQLRLRDLGGIIVVDFIDMERADHRQRVIDALAQALQRDRSRTKVIGLSELGLLQLTRKRTRSGLGAALTRTCVTCGGSGRTKTSETVAFDALTELRRVANAFTDEALTVRAHPDVARALALTLQTPSPIVDRDLALRVAVVPDAACRSDQFDVSAG